MAFDPTLHPRGADGRFIDKFGIVKFLLGGIWVYGQVNGIEKGSDGKAELQVQQGTLSGSTPGGTTHLLRPSQVYTTPKPVGFLKKEKGTKVGGQAGSNPGGFYSLPSPDGGEHKWYVKKAKTTKHGRNEELANTLYAAAGVPVPDVAFLDGDIYSRVIPDSTEDMSQRISSNDVNWLDQIRSNFVVDAWLANWDVFGLTWDNVKTDPDGTPYRIDNGGALLFRAQGAPKGKDFGPTVGELDSFREGKKAKVFGGMTKDQELDGAQRVLGITPDQIKQMVANAGLDEGVADTLIARRAYIADYYGLDLPEEIAAKASPPAPVDIADVTDGGGSKPRTWMKTPLAQSLALLQQGDIINFPDGKGAVYGDGMEFGIPDGVTAAAMQTTAWLQTYGPDAEIWIEKNEVGKPRPAQNASLHVGNLTHFTWERGDRLIGKDGTFKVVGVNYGTDVVMLQRDDDKSLYLVSSRHESKMGPFSVERWDKDQIEPPVQNTKAEVTDVPESYTPKPKETLAPKPTQGQVASEAIKQDVETTKKKASGPGKAPGSMILGDGTEASKGDKVLSVKDGKTYLYVKKKGPYSVVTDPDSDDPDKTYLKLATTLSQPNVEPVKDPAVDIQPPTTKDGIVPQVGMIATAKDGHTGEIVMISPNGKFVFITDSSGKKKRKSVGTVTIQDKKTDVTPEPVKTTDVSGATIVNAADVPGLTYHHGYGNAEVVGVYPPNPQEYTEDIDNPMFVGVVYADGTYGVELPGPQPEFALAKVGSTIAGYQMDNWNQMTAENWVATSDQYGGQWTFLYAGELWEWTGQMAPDGGPILKQKSVLSPQYIEVPLESPSGKKTILMARKHVLGSVPSPSDSIPSYAEVTKGPVTNASMADPDFLPLAQLSVQAGDKISNDGVNWLTVTKVVYHPANGYMTGYSLESDSGQKLKLGAKTKGTFALMKGAGIPETPVDNVEAASVPASTPEPPPFPNYVKGTYPAEGVGVEWFSMEHPSSPGETYWGMVDVNGAAFYYNSSTQQWEILTKTPISDKDSKDEFAKGGFTSIYAWDPDQAAASSSQSTLALGPTLAAMKDAINPVLKKPGTEAKLHDVVTVVDLDGQVYTGRMLQDAQPGPSTTSPWVLYLKTVGGLITVQIKDDTTILNHGNLKADTNKPVAMSLEQYEAIGINEGDVMWTLDGKQWQEISGVAEGKVYIKSGTGNPIPIFDLGTNGEAMVQISKSGGPKPPLDKKLGYVPGLDTEASANPPEVPVAVMDAAKKQALGTSWGKQIGANVSVWMDYQEGALYWQNADGQVYKAYTLYGDNQVPVLDSSVTPDIFTSKTKSGAWVKVKDGTQPIVELDTVDEPIQFQVPPDYSLAGVGFATYALIPKGGEKDSTTWGFVNGDGSVTWGVFHEFLEPNTPYIVDMSEPISETGLSVVDKDPPPVPDGWKLPPNHPVPGNNYVHDMSMGDATWVRVGDGADGQGEWMYLDPDTGTVLAESKKYTDSTMKTAFDEKMFWTAEAKTQVATLNGHELGPSAEVIQSPDGYYYVENEPGQSWKIILANGEMVDTSDSDFFYDGKINPTPMGTKVWPQGADAVTPAGPPTVEIGGKSPNFPEIYTEKWDDLPDFAPSLPAGVDPASAKVIKSLNANGEVNAYFVIYADNINPEDWYYQEFAPGTTVPEYTVAVPYKSQTEIYDAIKSSEYLGTVLTDVTPETYVPKADDGPDFPKIADETVNPKGQGYGGLEWQHKDESGWPTVLGVGEVNELSGYTFIKVTKADDENFLPQWYAIHPDGNAINVLPVNADGVVDTAAAGTAYSKAKGDWPDPDMTALQVLMQDQSSAIDGLTFTHVSSEVPIQQVSGVKTNGEFFSIPLSFGDEHYVAHMPGQGEAPINIVRQQSDGAWYMAATATGKLVKLFDNDEEMAKAKKTGNWKMAYVAPPSEPKMPTPDGTVNGPNDDYTVGDDVTAVTLGLKGIAGYDEVAYAIAPGSKVFKKDDEGKTNWFVQEPDGTYVIVLTPGYAAPWYGGSTLPPGTEPVKIADVTIATKPVKKHTSVPDKPQVSAPPDAQDLVQPKNLIEFDTYMDFAQGVQPGQIISTTGADGTAHYYEITSTDNYSVIGLKWVQENGVWTKMDDGVALASSVPWYVPATKTPKKAAPEVPVPTQKSSTGVDYPGASKPTAEDISSWGGALTKDGFIPTSGMYVTGKGPMNGQVLSVSKDKTKAVVLTSDGKKTTRLITALSVDHAANYVQYGQVELKDVPEGQYLSVDTPTEAVAKALDNPGKFVGIMSANTANSTVMIRAITGPDGKPMLRAYARLTPERRQSLVSTLTSDDPPPKGGWNGLDTPSSGVKAGDMLAMRFGTTNSNWKPDANGTEPTHEVLSVFPHPSKDKVLQVELRNTQTGETITSNFHMGPGKTVNVFSWDPDKIMPAPSKGTMALSQKAKGEGWSIQDGRQITTVDKYGKLSSGSRVGSSYGNAGAKTLVHVGADGSRTEVIVPSDSSSSGKRATDGFMAITVPAGPNSDGKQSLLAALERTTGTYTPPSQPELRKQVVTKLRSMLSFDIGKVEDSGIPNADDPNNPKVKDLFKKVGTKIGIPDIGWQDVYVGQDSRGNTVFYWSDRVTEAMEKKSPNGVVVKANKNGTANAIVSNLVNGVLPGPIRVAESQSDGASASSDDANKASFGGFFSLVQGKTGAVPKGNPMWNNSPGMTLYFRPGALFRRINDTRANKTDAFGKPQQGHDSLGKMLGDGNVMDVYVGDGLDPEDIAYMRVESAAARQDAIEMLKKQGITHIAGRPIESIIITGSQYSSIQKQDLPKSSLPSNAIPLLQVPEDVSTAVEAVA